MSYENTLKETARLTILRFVEEAPGHTHNVSMLTDLLKSSGITMGRDKVTAEVMWLQSVGLVTTQEFNGFMVVNGTSLGIEVAQGTSTYPGVKRPRPKVRPMPPPKKLDLMPAEFRQWLAETLQKHGFGNIVQITDDLNFKLAEAGQELRIGKSAVGEFSALLKHQRDAFSMAETLLGDLDIEHESTMHKVLMQMCPSSGFLGPRAA